MTLLPPWLRKPSPQKPDPEENARWRDGCTAVLKTLIERLVSEEYDLEPAFAKYEPLEGEGGGATQSHRFAVSVPSRDVVLTAKLSVQRYDPFDRGRMERFHVFREGGIWMRLRNHGSLNTEYRKMLAEQSGHFGLVWVSVETFRVIDYVIIENAILAEIQRGTGERVGRGGVRRDAIISSEEDSLGSVRAVMHPFALQERYRPHRPLVRWSSFRVRGLFGGQTHGG